MEDEQIEVTFLVGEPLTREELLGEPERIDFPQSRRPTTKSEDDE